MWLARRGKTLWFKSSAASREGTWCGRCVVRAGAQPYLGPRTRSGDMMIDGVPDVRAAEEGAAAHSFREVHPTAGWPQEY
jgi:hypothetical protein